MAESHHSSRHFHVAKAFAGHKVLLLCQNHPFQAEAINDHITALKNLPDSTVDTYSIHGELPSSLDLELYDAIIIHYTLFVYSDRCLSPLARWRIRQYRGVTAVFLHDEYKHVNSTISILHYLRTKVLFTVIPNTAWRHVYPRDKMENIRLVHVLTGYVPDRLVGVSSDPAASRPIHIGYRGRVYPAWHGRAGRERVAIAERTKMDALSAGLTFDISTAEGARLYGRRWIRFIKRCKSMLGTESDVSVIDLTGEVATNVAAHLRANPKASDPELKALYFADLEDKVSIAQVSPRLFEAIALRTLLVQYKGSYSGVVEPDVHYLVLHRDHSNFDEIATILRDSAKIDQITREAYRHVIESGNWSYRSFAHTVAVELRRDWQKSDRARKALPGRRRTARHLEIKLRWGDLRLYCLSLCVRGIDLAGERIGVASALSVKRHLADAARFIQLSGRLKTRPSTLVEENSIEQIYARARVLSKAVGEPILTLSFDYQGGRIHLSSDAIRDPRPEHGERSASAVQLRIGKSPIPVIWQVGDVAGPSELLLKTELSGCSCREKCLAPKKAGPRGAWPAC